MPIYKVENGKLVKVGGPTEIGNFFASNIYHRPPRPRGQATKRQRLKIELAVNNYRRFRHNNLVSDVWWRRFVRLCNKHKLDVGEFYQPKRTRVHFERFVDDHNS